MRSNYRNKVWIRKYKFQFILGLCLIIAPFLLYSHLFFDPIQTSFELFGQNYELVNIPVQIFAWILISALTSILILTILFFSISDVWRYSLLFPLVIFLEYVITCVNDVTSILYASPVAKYLIVLFLVIGILLIDHSVFKKYRRQVLNFKLHSLILQNSRLNFKNIDKKLRRLNPEFDKSSNSNLLYGLYNSKLRIEEILKNNNWYGVSDRIKMNPLRSIFCSLLVLLSTGPWFWHYYIPEGLSNYNLGLLSIGSHGFYDVQVFIWGISRKIMVIVPMVIWFITYHSWWRYAILSPLILHLYQFWEAFQVGYTNVDAYGNYKVFPLVLLSIILVLLLSGIVRRHSHSLDAYEQIKQKIDYLIQKLGEEKSGVGDYRNRFENIRNKLTKESETDSKLAELTQLQRELQRKLIS